jgi:hypothetical protein
VSELVARGRVAGQKVVSPNCFDWDVHRVTRYRTLMQMLQQGLGHRGAGRACVYSGTDCDTRVPFRDRLEAYATGTSTLPDVKAAWCQLAMPASDALINWAMQFGPDGEIDFDEEAPRPKPTMRIVPAV